MNNISFVSLFAFKGFKQQFRKYLFTLIIVLCGVFLINTALTFFIAGNKLMDMQFKDNKSLRQLIVKPTDQNSLSLSEIEYWKADSRYSVFPNIIGPTSDVPEFFTYNINGSKQIVPILYIVVPYEALSFYGIDGIDKEKYENQNGIILNNTENSSFGSMPKPAVGIDFFVWRTDPENPTQKILDERTKYFNEVCTNDEKAMDAVFTCKVLKYDSIKGFSDKYSNFAVMSLNTYKKIGARNNMESVPKFLRESQVPAGMTVIVNNFDDVENVVKDFEHARFVVDYTLSDFKNLSMTINIAKLGSIIFGILIGLIVFISIFNTIGQLLYSKRHEIGLMVSQGFTNSNVSWVFIMQMLINVVFVTLFLYIVEIALIKYIEKTIQFIKIGNWFELSFEIILIDFVFLVVVVLAACIIPLYSTLRRQPAMLLKEID